MIDEDKYLTAFASVPDIGPARLRLLRDFFGNAGKAWLASEEELEKTGLPKKVLLQFLSRRNNLDVSKYERDVRERGIKYLTINNRTYPERLKNIPDPPNVIFLKSNLTIEQFSNLTMSKIIAVVGTRKMTSYGKEVTEALVQGLVDAGFTIVSGMALGIDGVAHGTALNSKGVTIAVLGAGVDIIYPREHRDLYHKIIESGGAIVSEVAPEKMVGRGIFPARNRIISGLSEAVLVTEGAMDSGSLITARSALEQGREVFAVPGPINSQMHEGVNYLLKQGAKLVTSVKDIVEELGYESSLSVQSKQELPRGDTPDEQKIIDLLIQEPLDFDELVRRTGMSSKKLGSLLATMEVEGKLKSANLIYRLFS